MVIAMRPTTQRIVDVGLLLLVTLKTLQAQEPTYAPTSSMFPTITAWPTYSMWPTITSYPTVTSYPTLGIAGEQENGETFPPVLVEDTIAPTEPPVIAETPTPTDAPTVSPPQPSLAPAPGATTSPPTVTPVTSAPDVTASSAPSVAPPVGGDTDPPTGAPTAVPTPAVVGATQSPSNPPDTDAPSSGPTVATTIPPTRAPTTTPATPMPTEVPVVATMVPSAVPSAVPTVPASTPPSMPPVDMSQAPSVPDAGASQAPSSEPTVKATGAPSPTPGVGSASPTGSWWPTTTPYPTTSNFPTITDYPTSSSPPTELQPSAAPSMTPNTTAPTSAPSMSAAPSPEMTAAPSRSSRPSLAPSAGSAAPTGVPSAVPTTPPTSKPTGTPTASPVTPSPTMAGVRIRTELKNIQLVFEGAGELLGTEIESWELDTATMATGYFLTLNRGGRRSLVEAGDVRDFSNSVQLVRQNVQGQGNARTNTITYDQTLDYIAIDPETHDAATVAVLPFEDEETSENYASGLRLSFANFENLIEFDPPAVPPQDGEPEGGDDGLSGGAIAGIAIAGAVVVLGGGYAAYSMMGGSDRDGYTDPNGKPPPQFNISADEDVSTIDDPGMRKTQSDAEPSLLEGGYGDQSVATVDYDYSKAYGGGDTSVVSSAGGTMGDTTRQTSDQAANSAALAALGAESQFRSSTEAGTKEEVMEIIAPAGKLGVVIDTPDDGAPVVHAVKDSSVIADQIQVGDKLIAVDDEDVRSMTAIKVSKLISKKSANPERKLTIIRTSLVDEP